jgi:hypothetical protein
MIHKLSSSNIEIKFLNIRDIIYEFYNIVVNFSAKLILSSKRLDAIKIANKDFFLLSNFIDRY